MRRFANLPIKRKLTLISMLTSTVALLLVSAAFVTYELITYQEDLVGDVSSVAEIIGYNSASALSFNDAGSAAETMRALGAKPHIVAACIYDQDGQVFALYPEGHPVADFALPPAGAVERFGANRLDVFRPITLSGENVGTIYLRTDLAGMQERLRRYALIIATILVLAIFVAYLIASRLQRVISHPLTQLASVAARVATEKDYALRARKQGDDEIGRLIDGFNEMLDQIQSRNEELRQARDELEKRVEERTAGMALAQARFKFIFDSVPVGISWQVPNQFETHLTNSAHQRLTGVSDEVSRQPGAFARVSHPDDYRRQMALVEKFVRGEIDHIALEKRYLHPDARVVWVIFTSHMFTDTITGEKQSLTTLVDITERKQAEERLAKSLSVLHATLESTTDGILVIDFTGKITNYNQKFVEIWRMPPDVLATGDNQRAIDYVLSQLKEPETFTRKIQSLLAQPEAASFDVLEFADGRVVERHSQPHRVTGETVGRVWSFRDVTERRRAEEELQKVHRELIGASRQAGMAEVATGVLHNVGNVLNSVNVSATLICDRVRQTEAGKVAKLAAMLEEQQADLAAFLTTDPRGRLIPGYLGTLAAALANEQQATLGELDQLRKNIDHIKEIVAVQQSYARASGINVSVAVTEIVDDALRMNAGALRQHGIEVIRDDQARPTVSTDKHKVMQILINLIRNAKYACDDSGRTDKQITLRTAGDGHTFTIAVTDNGIGIPAENLTRIFSHGFTTRAGGHGFGLHSGALAARELGGSLSVRSAGAGHGATFTLELPCHPPTASPLPP